MSIEKDFTLVSKGSMIREGGAYGREKWERKMYPAPIKDYYRTEKTLCGHFRTSPSYLDINFQCLKAAGFSADAYDITHIFWQKKS